MLVAAILCGLVAVSIAAMVIGAVMLDLVGHLADGLRRSMLMLAAGLIWGGIDRYRHAPVGFGDLLFLIGVAGVLYFAWAKQWAAALDRLDGRPDGPSATSEKAEQ